MISNHGLGAVYAQTSPELGGERSYASPSGSNEPTKGSNGAQCREGTRNLVDVEHPEELHITGSSSGGIAPATPEVKGQIEKTSESEEIFEMIPARGPQTKFSYIFC